MKRVLVVLLALVMGAGLLFAADPPKWGVAMSGTFYLWNQDSHAFLGNNVTGQDTGFTLSGADGDFSFTATVEPDGDAWAAPTWRNIQGSYTLFDKMLKLTAGKDRISDYRATTFIQGGNAYTRFANAEFGFALQVYPVTGLSAGAFIKFPFADDEVGVVQDYADNLGFGASYALEGIGTFNVVFRTMDSGTTPALLQNEFGFSANISAIKILPLVLGVGIKMYDVNDPAYTILFSTKYGVSDALNVLLDVSLAYQTAFAYAAEVQTTYALNKSWTAGLDLYYGSSMYDYGDMINGGFAAKPWVKLQVGTNNWLKLGVMIDLDGDGTGTGDMLRWNIPFYYEINL